MYMNNSKQLQKIAQKIRKEIILMTSEVQSGHYSSSLSIVDLLVALYYSELNHDPKNPNSPNRDRFVLSKGHAAPALYAILVETGYFPVEELKTLRKIGSRLQGHPVSHLLPGLDASSGSLGQGLSTTVGMAIAGKLDQKTIVFSHWMSFGWKVFEVNGHDFTALLTAFKEVRNVKNQPTEIDEWGRVNG